MLEIIIVLCLIGLNGLFALSELAIVSARRSRLRAMVEAGRKGARRALALADDPGRFLSTVQIGITLEDRRDYQTVAGFVLAQLHRLPKTGESVEALGWRFEVVDLDGRRIDKVLATRVANVRRRLA